MIMDGDVSWQQNVYKILPGPDPKAYPYDYAISDDNYAPCMGFFWTRSTPQTIEFWSELDTFLKRSPSTRDQVKYQ